MSNVIMLPNAKTYLYNNRIRLNKETRNRVMELLYDNLKMTRKQSNSLDQRLEICEKLKKLLPKSKHKLLEKYSNLYAMETDSILEAAIVYIIQNENEVSEALVNY